MNMNKNKKNMRPIQQAGPAEKYTGRPRRLMLLRLEWTCWTSAFVSTPASAAPAIFAFRKKRTCSILQYDAARFVELKLSKSPNVLLSNFPFQKYNYFNYIGYMLYAVVAK